MLELLRHILRIFVVLPLAAPIIVLTAGFFWLTGDFRRLDRIADYFLESIILGRTL
jgi:ABC-type Fe3+ transport system permease subunit